MEALARMRNWLGLGEEPSPKAAQDHSRFNFSPDLIRGLKGDHGELLTMFGGIEKMAVEKRYAEIPGALGRFKERLDTHLLHENLHFYCYVEQKAGTPQARELIKGFRSEMNAIARAVINFVKTYRQAGVHPANGQTFLAELRQVGAQLVSRIDREEQDLYTLYKP